ncbi:nucleotide exchange factor GrpE [Candidatus Curtissbacteria bacterium RIFCSPLOWO2_01_FULL_42_26]|uniref:Protein GrpE n=1 Tax=Candidatus Curtissbacteria bacterium RIFCSPLOWO2_01_FULL_42_26 TaxID=1797729 RepID=A0A1F5I1W9_9BACT|nr:MAG: nucleotide exchange factor GrpE [Candidatus Curtissbacteria bacterium RIFCSPLOWO2_01_FULL_42_26]
MKKGQKSALNTKEAKKQSIDQVSARNTQLEDMLKRTLADYQNLERRIEEERKQLSKLSSLLLIEKLLPILDNLENAQMHLSDEGLKIVIKQFKDILISEGLQEINAENAQFDPNFHEAVEIKEGAMDNKIVKILTKGYTIDGKTIRPAKVVVERRSANDQILDRVENDAIGGENV